MRSNKGFTLIECIITLGIYSIVLSLALGLYLTGYTLYRHMEYQVEVEESLRISLNTISGNIRRTDMPKSKVSVLQNKLIIDLWEYSLQGGILYEQKGTGKNQLALNISAFEPNIENGILTVVVYGKGNNYEAPIPMTLVVYLGGE